MFKTVLLLCTLFISLSVAPAMSLAHESLEGLEGLEAHGAHTAHTAHGSHGTYLADSVAASSNGRHYPPHRTVDIKHLKLDITPDFENSTIKGYAGITFSPILKPLYSLRLDAVDLKVSKVSATTEVRDFEVTRHELLIHFKRPIKPGEMVTAAIQYHAEPQSGLNFKTPKTGYKVNDTHVWSQGEPHHARYWYPSFDYPNERFTTEMICRVPKDMNAISNGKRVSDTLDAKTNLRVVHYKMDKPHVNYLVCLYAGRIKTLSNRYRDIPLNFHTTIHQAKHAQATFQVLDGMLAYYEDWFGVKYPWSKYDQAIISDAWFGAMENTSLTTLSDRLLYAPEIENIADAHNITAHELIHHWFGNLITCRDWAHLWLNEGLTTYFAALWDEKRFGTDDLNYRLYLDAQRILKSKASQLPIVHDKFDNAWQQFDIRAYQKGAWVIHMLRQQVGDRVFKQALKTYLDEHQYTSVVTRDLLKIFEDQSGLSLARFADQWLYHGGNPKLKIEYKWDDTSKTARLTVQQTQEINEKTLLFELPLEFAFHAKDGAIITHRFTMRQKQQDYIVKLATRPEVVRFDPKCKLLAEVTFEKPSEMLLKQLALNNDAMGRVIAAKALKGKLDLAAIRTIAGRLKKETFWAARKEIIRNLKSTNPAHDVAILNVLAGYLTDKDARVRQAATRTLAELRHEQSYQLLLKRAKLEHNPFILSVIASGLIRYPGPQTSSAITQLLSQPSHRERTATGIIAELQKTSDPTYISSIKATIKAADQREFAAWDFRKILQTLGSLGQHQTDKTDTLKLLSAYLANPNPTIRVGAIQGLGELRDPRGIHLIEPFKIGNPKFWPHEPATKAIKQIREAQSPPLQLGELRKRLKNMEQRTQKQSTELNRLKSKLTKLEKTANVPAKPGKTAKPAAKDKLKQPPVSKKKAPIFAN